VKTVIALALVLSTSSAMALSSKSSWTQIFASNATLIFEESLGAITLDNACLTATEVRSIQPVTMCEKMVPVYEVFDQVATVTWVCEKWTPTQLAYSRTSQRLTCMETGLPAGDHGCYEYGEEPTTIADTISVGVVELGNVLPSFNKDFTFPVCQ
jgi:hypothetical protein